MNLKTVFRPDGHTAPLRDKTVEPKTFEVDYVDVPVLIQAFRRMVRGLEYDICELAMTTYICARAYGKRFTAIPVFPARVEKAATRLYPETDGFPARAGGTTAGRCLCLATRRPPPLPLPPRPLDGAGHALGSEDC